MFRCFQWRKKEKSENVRISSLDKKVSPIVINIQNPSNTTVRLEEYENNTKDKSKTTKTTNREQKQILSSTAKPRGEPSKKISGNSEISGDSGKFFLFVPRTKVHIGKQCCVGCRIVGVLK